MFADFSRERVAPTWCTPLVLCPCVVAYPDHAPADVVMRTLMTSCRTTFPSDELNPEWLEGNMGVTLNFFFDSGAGENNGMVEVSVGV